MRCKCCDSVNTTFVLGDWYCENCTKSIRSTIKDDRYLAYILEMEKDKENGLTHKEITSKHFQLKERQDESTNKNS